MKTLQKTSVLAAVLVGVLVGVAPAGTGETVINNGETISGFSGSLQSIWVGRIYVPAGARQFIVSTSGGSGDCDLYLRREQVNQSSWEFRSESNSNDERIALAMPAEGWWQVGLISVGNYTGLTLHAQFDDPRRQAQPQPQPQQLQFLPKQAQVLQTSGVDEFEPNSKRELALQIFAGHTQLHTINPDGDEDWIMFVPRLSGRYALRLTNVTIDLEGELWVQSGRDKEKRVEKFKVSRGRDSELLLEVDSRIGYFKLRIEADDNDDVGSYRLDVKQVSVSANHKVGVRRPDVFESDNKPEVAIGILSEEPQLHTIYPRDDEDWLVFAPTRPGEYLLKFSNVTTDLKVELWVQRGDDKERRIDKFGVSRWGRTITLHADHRVRHFRIRVEADDNDDTGDYRLDVLPRPITTATTVFGTTVVRSTLITPRIIYRRPGNYRYCNHYGRINHHGRSSHGRHSGRSLGVVRSTRITPTSSRSRGTGSHGYSRFRTTPPTRSTVSTPSRTHTRTTTPTRSTFRTPSRIPTRTTTPTRSTVGTPSRIPTRTTTPTRSTVGTPSRIPTRTTTPTRSTVSTPSRTPARTATPTRSTIGTPSRTPSRIPIRIPSRNTIVTPNRTVSRSPSRTPTRTITPTRSTVGTPSRTPTRTITPTRSTIGTPSRTPTRTTTPTRSTFRTPSRTPTRTITPTRSTVSTPSRTPARTTTPTRSTIGTPSRTPSRIPIRIPSRNTIVTPNRTVSRSPSRTYTRTTPSTRSTVRTPSRIPTRATTPTRSTVGTPSRTPTRTTIPTRSTVRTPSRTASRIPIRAPSRNTIVTPRRTVSRSPSRTPSRTVTSTPIRTPSRTRSTTPSRTTSSSRRTSGSTRGTSVRSQIVPGGRKRK